MMTQPLKIGVLGSGPAGQTLATGFLDKGHPVMIGSRDSTKLDGWLHHAGPGAQIGSFAETAEFGDVVLLSVLGSAAEDVVRLAGVENIDLDADEFDGGSKRGGRSRHALLLDGDRLGSPSPRLSGERAGVRGRAG